MSVLNENIELLLRNCRHLMDSFREAKNDLKKIEAEKEVLQQIIAEKEKMIVNLNEQLTNQKIAGSIATDQDNESMKRKLNEYIKELDQCLALLNN